MAARRGLFVLAIASTVSCGYVRRGATLRVGYQGFDAASHYSFENGRYVGAYPEVTSLLARELGVVTEDVTLGFNDDDAILDSWIEPLRNGDIDFTLQGTPFYDGFFYSSPVLTITQRGLVKVSHRDAGLWSIFAPFHWKLWLAIFGAVVLGTVVMGAIAYLNEEWAPRRDPLEFGTMLYHSVTLLLGGDDLFGVMATDSGGARLHRLGLLFLALVTTATFTANLAAFLTNPERVVHGPRSLEELGQSTACLTYDFMTPYLENLVVGVVLPPDGLFTNEDYRGRSAWCIDRVKSEDVDVFITSEANVHALEDCAHLAVASNVEIMPSLFYAVTRDIHLMVNLSYAMEELRINRDYYEALNRHYRTYDACDDASADADESAQISVGSFASVFFLYFANAALSVAIAASEARRRGRAAAAKEEPAAEPAAEAAARPTMADLYRKRRASTEKRRSAVGRGRAAAAGRGAKALVRDAPKVELV